MIWMTSRTSIRTRHGRPSKKAGKREGAGPAPGRFHSVHEPLQSACWHCNRGFVWWPQQRDWFRTEARTSLCLCSAYPSLGMRCMAQFRQRCLAHTLTLTPGTQPTSSWRRRSSCGAAGGAPQAAAARPGRAHHRRRVPGAHMKRSKARLPRSARTGMCIKLLQIHAHGSAVPTEHSWRCSVKRSRAGCAVGT